MNKEYWLRKAHRYMGIFVGIQLLFWGISGLYFTWNDIEKVRGAHMANSVGNDIQAEQFVDIAWILRSFRERMPQITAVKGIQLRLLLGQPVYEISYTNSSGEMYQLVNARTGVFMPMVDEETAVRLAKADFTEETNVKSVALLQSASPHAEYRGRDLPIYRVTMDHPSGVNIYVSAQRGMVTARRNATWRIFDFLWMLHTMDYDTRDDFNNMLVKVFSLLGLITVLSGFLLWGMSSSLFRKI